MTAQLLGAVATVKEGNDASNEGGGNGWEVGGAETDLSLPCTRLDTRLSCNC